MNRGQEVEEAYRFEWVQAPSDLAPYVNSLYILCAGSQSVDDVMPAYSGQLVLTLRGGATMKFANGSHARASAAFVQSPFTQAHPFTLEPNTLMLGVSLNFRGWTALTDLPVNEYCDSYVAIEKALPADLAEEAVVITRRCKAGELGETEALDALADIVRRGLKPPSDRHMQVIDTTLEWLSASLKPKIEDLQDALPYSERQVQRLVTRFFGQPPVRLIRRYRAVRAATLLAMPDLAPKLEAEIREAFYDQAHMIKEIRHFTGRTPRRLQPKEQSVVKDTLAPDGYSSVDLFGGNQDEELGKQ